MATTEKTTKAVAAKKPKAAATKKVTKEPKVTAVAPVETPEISVGEAAIQPVVFEKPTIPGGRYVFATGRRKSAVATIRLFSGAGENVVNKKPAATYFSYDSYLGVTNEAFERTGFMGDFHYTATVRGGGSHAQAAAVRHAIAIALGGLSLDVRKVLKKNSLLTRDPREKERKKPGLKRARRRPQWAKR